jgi:hypothetical protein
MTLRLLAILLLVFASWAMAQTSAQKPPADNKNVTEALKVIQGKINEQGEIRYTMVSENAAKKLKVENKYAVQSGQALIDAAACTISVDVHMTKDGKTQTHGRDTVYIRDVTALVVQTQSRLIRQKTARMGIAGWVGKVSPESYVLQTMHSGRVSGMFFFRTEETANQTADAVARATKLCGGRALL